MANRDNPHGFIAEYTLSGGAFPVFHGKMAASLSLKKGDTLIFSSGYLTLGLASSTAIAGICMEDKTSSAGEYPTISYTPVTPDVIFSAQCSGTATQAMIGTIVDIEGASGVQEINENATAVGVVRLLGVKPNSVLGLNVEMLCQLVSAFTAA